MHNCLSVQIFLCLMSCLWQCVVYASILSMPVSWLFAMHCLCWCVVYADELSMAMCCLSRSVVYAGALYPSLQVSSLPAKCIHLSMPMNCLWRCVVYAVALSMLVLRTLAPFLQVLLLIGLLRCLARRRGIGVSSQGARAQADKPQASLLFGAFKRVFVLKFRQPRGRAGRRTNSQCVQTRSSLRN